MRLFAWHANEKGEHLPRQRSLRHLQVKEGERIHEILSLQIRSLERRLRKNR